MIFVIIMVVIISGLIVEWMKFGVFIVFILIWVVVVYVLIIYWVWGGGWLVNDGVFDFVGGIVVYINLGVVGLVVVYMLGKCMGLGCELMVLYNLVLIVVGVSLLWVGWFGFNGGFVLGVNGLVGYVLFVM